MEKIKSKIIFKYNNTLNYFIETLTQSSSKDGFIRYFKNTGWLFLGKISGMIASFFVGAYVARYLGPTQYGLLNYAISFTGLFAIIASLGIDSILNRELISYPEKRDSLLGSGFLLKMLGSIITIILIIISLFFIETDKITEYLIIFSASVFIFNAFGVIDTYFQSQVLAKKTVRIQIFLIILSSIIKLIFIYKKLGVMYFMLSYFIDSLVLSIGLLLSYKKMGLLITKWKIDKKIIIMLLKNSWPLILSGAAIMIYMKIDQVMIGNMLGIKEVGLYSVAVKISEIWYFIPGIICASLLPAIINAKNTDLVIYNKRLKNLYSLLFYSSLLIAIPISLLSNIIIISLFGPNYIGAINVLRIHVWAGIGVFLGSAINQYLIIEGKSKIFLYTTIIGAILNIILNIILIPKIGIIGAAISTLIAYTFQAFSIIFFKETRNQIFLILKAINIF